MEGVINVYKEPGWTSSDVVNKLKGVLHERHIGHGGTLDPAAEGVLPVCVGRATKLFDYLTAFHKIYLAHVVFGKTTDTQDGAGTVLSEASPDFTEEQLRETLNAFVGEIEQIPPMYSALHVDGQRLYDLARQGKSVDLAPRKVTVLSVEMASPLKDYECDLRIVCCKGTYIRTICHDLGQKLGCGAYMAHLLRESAAGFDVKNAKTIPELIDLMQTDDRSFLHPIEDVLWFMPALVLPISQKKKLDNGINPPLSEAGVPSENAAFYRVYCENTFYGIGEIREKSIKLLCRLGGDNL